MDYDFDVIVVGAGVAGCIAATQLSREGHEVLLVERGVEPGAKNLSGGVFYTRVLDEVFPDFVEQAPIERIITRNTLSFLNEDSAVNIDYWDRKLAEPVNAVSVLRAHLDPWLAEQAEEAGVAIIPGIKVDRLLREGTHFTGIEAAGEQMRAKVTIVAEGVNSFLAHEAGVRATPKSKHLGLGVKSVIRIGEQAVQERFNLTGNEGAAYAIVGDATLGVPGGGFLYTNKDSISIGVVLMLDKLTQSGLASSDIHDHMINHPYYAPFLEGGELLEYGCHLVAEGGEAMQEDLVHDGLVLIGDAAGFTLNTGLTVRGMDMAAGSAISAARTVHDALEAGDYSRLQLNSYVTDYQSTFVGKDMHTYRRAPEFLENDPLMFTQVGPLLADVFYRAYNHDLSPRKPLVKVALDAFKASGVKVRDLARTGIAALRAL
ncbi:FAD-dependent oxidoreductase [Trueperella bialowiezensis]|uniref:Electron transfer flavoprotein-ubiquinone oxidoreductase n=1 Tax=Trueperella bialowiezensis TaxID=312285 RepID=A0A448PCM1_9ACTO|nr:FAD-dependent oxidoreductase [Trueperella bialowiezensis]VEI12678.1 Electron transfer flavoprotein-ubiquinone oxidoreductase [Trueperella bialowiezensis]